MEDYMKAIYKRHKQGGDGIVHISDIAADMGLRKASVSRATNILAEKGLVKKDKYKCFCLTESGLEYSLYIEQRYAVIMRFFTEVLKLDMDVARQDACGVEHVISGECYRSIRFFMSC